MLTRIHGTNPDREGWEVCMEDAAWPVPFEPGLEYNSAAHGTWNIVHTGMLLPGAHQIYVCADNCNRGVVLTAAEMNAMDRFSFIAVREDDFYNGQMEKKVIDGVGAILDQLSEKPTAVILFTVCIHHFMGCDISYIYEELRRRYPDQYFIESYMDPIMQKEGATPDEKLRAGLYSILTCRHRDDRQVNFIGSDFALDPDSEILDILKFGEYKIKDLPACRDFDEYLSMGDSFLNICTYPPGQMGARRLSERLGMKYLYMPLSFDYKEIDRQLLELGEMLYRPIPATSALKTRCEQDYAKTKEMIGDTPIVIDLSFCPRPLGLAKALIIHGFNVERIFTDAFSPEEEKDYLWLKEHAPKLRICSVIQPAMRRFLPKQPKRKVLALGQKAAYFYRTPHFVNLVQGGGLHGYYGIMTMLRLMREAWQEEKDTQDLVVRKGLGCESCI